MTRRSQGARGQRGEKDKEQDKDQDKDKAKEKPAPTKRAAPGAGRK
jgi:hypothetical protein